MISQRILKLQPSPTLTLDAKVKQLQNKGIPIINLSLGEPDFKTPENISKAAIEAINTGFTHYTPAAGILELREAISKKLEKENAIYYQPSEIIVGVGTKQVLYTIFQILCQKGDEVILTTPTWATYVEQIKLSEAKSVLIPLESPFKLTTKILEKYITSKTKAILINTPSNPTGATIDEQELKGIAALAVKHNIFVISDEIYEKILYKGKHVSIASYGEEMKKLTITVNGFSKAYAMTGWRIGYGAGPEEIIKAMVSFCGQTTSGTSSISQKGAVEALTGSQSSVKKMALEFKKRKEFICKEFEKIGGIPFAQPEGAFYLFVNISKLLGRKYKSSENWSEGLLEQAKVAVVPGEAFYAPNFIRISFAASLEHLRAGCKQIKEFMQNDK